MAFNIIVYPWQERLPMIYHNLRDRDVTTVKYLLTGVRLRKECVNVLVIQTIRKGFSTCCRMSCVLYRDLYLLIGTWCREVVSTYLKQWLATSKSTSTGACLPDHEARP